MKLRRRLRRVLLVFVIVYVVVYFGLSRRGYAEADRYGFRGFYYLEPEDSTRWRALNYGCAYLFAPINAVDRFVGTGRAPASEPLWGMTR